MLLKLNLWKNVSLNQDLVEVMTEEAEEISLMTEDQALEEVEEEVDLLFQEVEAEEDFQRIEEGLAMTGSICTRCGKPRVVIDTYEEKVESSTVTYTITECSDPECQKMVNKALNPLPASLNLKLLSCLFQAQFVCVIILFV